VETETNPFQSLGETINPLLPPLATTGIVIVFVMFMLIARESLRDRIIGLVGEQQLMVTTQAIDDAARRVSRYLVMMLMVATLHGTMVAIGLYLIGVPQPLLWGALSLVLRFVPYVGPWLAAAFPILLSLAVFDTWYEPMMAIGLFVVLELITNNVLEPVFYGSGTGVSPVAILVSAVFWAWLWGGPGLVLSTPLTVCLVVIGQHFPRMRTWAVLLSDKPGMSPQMHVYQRLLAMDQDAVFQFAKDYLKTHSLRELYDEVFLGSLLLGERDRHRGALDTERQQFVISALRDVIDDLPEHLVETAAAASKADAKEALGTPEPLALLPVLCVAAHDEADSISAQMLAQLLAAENIVGEAMIGVPLVAEVLERIEQFKPRVVCVSAMPPSAVMHARHLCKRICAKFPDLPIVVGVWKSNNRTQAIERIRSCGTEQVVTSLTQAMEQLRM